MRILSTAIIVVAAVAATPRAAEGFCGFYVGGAGSDLFNNATQVVLMREGTRTVLSMQNNYQGPAQNFAMVVPVPVVLQKENVKTLDKAIFARVDQLAAPRLVEYWEQDPCQQLVYDIEMAVEGAATTGTVGGVGLGVTVEARFTVGEYEIVILSAKDSTGLDTWLKEQNYKIPEGAQPYLEPYVEAGSKFFVAKVDPKKVKFEDGMATLSPLRFHYDSGEFSLPVRLGMINSRGTQDLIVHILARGQRYEVANYENVTVPTNLEVTDETRLRFGEFYAALFDATVEKNPGAVVTEYAWDAGSCDPCPSPPLTQADLLNLGEDVLRSPPPSPKGKPRGGRADREAPPPPPVRAGGSFVLTRLHARYGKAEMADDLVFRAAQPIVGGRERYVAGNAVEKGSREDSYNNFQGRYIIRHPWTGAVACDNPHRGVWGGPPAGVDRSGTPKAAVDVAFAPRGKITLAGFVTGDVPGLPGIKGTAKPPATTETTKPPVAASEGTKTTGDGTKDTKTASKGCAVGSPGGDRTAGPPHSIDGAGLTLVLWLVAGLLPARRRRAGA